jgi:DNA repair exonuclease SbcCD nuclease subunit
MAKIALICDTHYGVRNDSPVFHAYFEKCMEHFFSVLEEKNVNHIIHLGDLFDRRKYLNYLTSKVCRDSFLIPIEGMEIETHIIAGNHDRYYKDVCFVNSLDETVTGRYKAITTYNFPQVINIDGLDILLVPWIDQSNAQMTYDLIKSTKAEVVMGHLEMKGFELLKGNIATHGDDVDVYSKFDLVFSGHYHHKSSKGNIHYLGAFGEYTWSDYNDPRGFTIFDTSTREFEFIQNPYTMFKMMAYDDVKEPNIIEKINGTDYSKYKDTYVKVLCVNRNNAYAFDLLMDKLYKSNPIDISVIEDISSFIEIDENSEVDESQDTPTILDSYINGLTLPVNNDNMKKFMRDVYTEALSVEHI